MSFSSKPRKLKPKGTVWELKLVQIINRHGADNIKAEEVQTPSRKAPSTSQPNYSSSIKHQKLGTFFDSEPIPCDLEGPDMPKKHQTLVFLFPSWPTIIFNNF